MTLPRLSAAGPEEVERQVVSLTTAPHGMEGEGFPVRRAFAGVRFDQLDPFIHMDQMGEVEYEPGQARGTGWHPHRGFETVTYIIDGRFQHQDSHGGGGMIENGATQWMTAGSGILHIEVPPEDLVDSGGTFHGIQLWVNLPASDKFIAPNYQNLEGNQVTMVTSPDGSALIRLIAGELEGHAGPGSTHTPITMAHATLHPDTTVSLPWREDFNALVYVLSGEGTVGTDGRSIRRGQLAVMGPGQRLTLTANKAQSSKEPTMEVLLLGGQPIGDPVVHYGPFVMNTRDQLVQAFEDFQAGKLGTIPADGLQPYHGKRG